MQSWLAVGALLLLVGGRPAWSQAWRTAAEARIDQHRKADLRVVVRDAAGQPVEGAAVRAAMTRHAFRFGTAVQSPWARSEPRADLTSTDLDLGEKLSAFRVPLDVPQGAVIASAFLQFTADKNDQTQATSLTIQAGAADDAPDFDQTAISSRERTAGLVWWEVPDWTQRGERAAAQRSPDVGPLVQEVVDRAGWRAGQHIVFVLDGSGKRSAQTADQDPDAAPRLIVTVAGMEHTSQAATSADDAEEDDLDFFGADAERYRRELVRLFNYASPGNALKWRFWERDPMLARGALDWLAAHDMPVRGHTMIWSSWRWNAIPTDVEERQDEPAYVRQRAADHVQAIAAAHAGEVLEWDVVNEPLHETDLEQIVGFDERVRWFQLAHEAAPNARLFVNDFDILEGPARTTAYKELVRDLIDAGAPVGGIGMQGHFLGQPPTAEQLVARLASMAELGLPLQITEFDMNRNWSAEQQAAFMEAVLVAAFAEPAVTAFNMWGFWDGNHWLGNAPLFARDWTLKPSGQVWMDYVFGHWWTEAEGHSDAAGVFDVRGVQGDYDITVDYEGDRVVQTIALREDADVVITLSNTTVAAEAVETPADFRITGVYPNPVVDAARVAFTLDAPSDVRLDVVDMLGRVVRSHSSARLASGPHRLTIEVGGLASGAYLLRVIARRDGRERAAVKPVLLLR